MWSGMDMSPFTAGDGTQLSWGFFGPTTRADYESGKMPQLKDHRGLKHPVYNCNCEACKVNIAHLYGNTPSGK